MLVSWVLLLGVLLEGISCLSVIVNFSSCLLNEVFKTQPLALNVKGFCQARSLYLSFSLCLLCKHTNNILQTLVKYKDHINGRSFTVFMSVAIAIRAAYQ